MQRNRSERAHRETQLGYGTAKGPVTQNPSHHRSHCNTASVVAETRQHPRCDLMQMRQMVASHGNEPAPMELVANPFQLGIYLAHCAVVMAGRKSRRRLTKRAPRAHDQPPARIEPKVSQKVPCIRGRLSQGKHGLTQGG